MNELIFYWEWLSLPKEQFGILAMLADKGEYKGNLTTLCKYFSLKEQSNSRNKLQKAIKSLDYAGFIQYSKKGQTHSIKPIPKEKEIKMPRKFFDSFRSCGNHSKSVAWEQVLKVWLWYSLHNGELVTIKMLEEDLRISASTIGAAKRVLSKEFGAFVSNTKKECVEFENGTLEFHTTGHIVELCAWLATKNS